MTPLQATHVIVKQKMSPFHECLVHIRGACEEKEEVSFRALRKMIRAVLVINNHGKARLLKFYEYVREDRQQQIVRECFNLVTKRSENLCNFLDGGNLFDEKTLIVYRQYATLYFIFCVDSSESELGVIDLIQVFVETLDKCFENVCELDIIFHMDKVNYVLDEIIVGGMVMEPNHADILAALASTKREEVNTRSSTPFGVVVPRVNRMWTSR